MSLMRRLFGLLPFLLILLALAGCQEKLKPGGKRFPNPARRIASLSPSTTEILAQGGAASYLVGRTDACNYPYFFRRFPVVVNKGRINYEALARVRPDLVVYDKLLYGKDETRKIEEFGVRTFGVGANSLAEFENELFELGKHFNSESTISEHVDLIHAARAQASSSPAPVGTKVALVMPSSSGEHYIVGTESFQADLIRAATGVPVGPKGDRFVPLNAEAFIQMNPDVILTSGKETSVLDDPRLQSLKAVKNGRVVPIMPDAILRRGWRVPETIRGINRALAGGTK